MLQKIKMVKPAHALVAGIMVICLIGLAYFALLETAPTVRAGDTIQVYYTGTLANGMIFDSNVGRQPFNFTVGANQVIPGFDRGVIGMTLNQNRTITIPANEAYGQANPALIVQVPLSQFGNQTVKNGTIITESSSSGGQTREGIATAVNSTMVTVNFNSPLAGQTLVFSVKVVGIKQK
jgi:FKBP-type peptidyl-prolyl cis-trans isomerase 2